jgi:hypothetical protein
MNIRTKCRGVRGRFGEERSLDLLLIGRGHLCYVFERVVRQMRVFDRRVVPGELAVAVAGVQIDCGRALA